MRIKFDYLTGPILGHRQRCEALQQRLELRGHAIVSDDNFDWLVVDYPEIPPCPTLSITQHRLVMGALPQTEADFAWAPIHESHERTLTGKEYLILDPALENIVSCDLVSRTLLTCGGADPLHLTEQLATVLEHVDAVIGPNFGRAVTRPFGWLILENLTRQAFLHDLAFHQRVVCTWGQTVFEAMGLQKAFVAIATQPDHLREANFLAVPCVKHDELDRIPELLEAAQPHDYGVDLEGAGRVARFMESIYHATRPRAQTHVDSYVCD